MRHYIVAPALYSHEAKDFKELLQAFIDSSYAVRTALYTLAEEPQPAALYSTIVESTLERMGLVERTSDLKFNLTKLGEMILKRHKLFVGYDVSNSADYLMDTLSHDVTLTFGDPDSELRSVAGVK